VPEDVVNPASELFHTKSQSGESFADKRRLLGAFLSQPTEESLPYSRPSHVGDTTDSVRCRNVAEPFIFLFRKSETHKPGLALKDCHFSLIVLSADGARLNCRHRVTVDFY
jgi:hypothetical protein